MRGSAREGSRLCQAGADDRRPIVLTDDEHAIETKHLGFAVSPHEECGVEEAVRLVEQHGGESVVLTLGPADAEEQLRDAMAIGIDRGIHLVTGGEEWDPEATAGAIVAADRRRRGRVGAVRPDLLRQRVGRLRRLPGRSTRCLRARPSLRNRAQERCRRGWRRTLRAGDRRRSDVYELPLPAVVTVLEGLNLPRYPSVPGRMRAGASRSRRSTPARPDSRLALSRLVVPAGEAKQAEVLGHGPDAAAAVVDLLEQIGVAS